MEERDFEGYYSDSRAEIVALVPKDVKNVLDIGCGTGLVGEALKKRGIENVVGIELNKEAAVRARQRLDMVIEGDVEKLDFPFESGSFDCVILGDVLEHLYDPWALLVKLRDYLSSGGVLVCSIPNIRHYHVLINLIRGRWEYKNEGVLDKTHLRFFTLRNIKHDLLNRSGYEIIEVRRNVVARRLVRLLNIFCFNKLINFITQQYLILARKEVKS